MANAVVSYFDINRDIRARRGMDMAEPKRIHWLPQWIALFLGVLIQPSFQAFRETGQWAFASWEWALFALITAFIIFPSVYRSAFDGSKPVVVLIGPIFVAGLGWQSLVGTILKAATA
jgi:hypothetical protein